MLGSSRHTTGDAIAERFGSPLGREYNLLNAGPSGNRLPEPDRTDRDGAQDPQAAEQVEIKTKYAGYIERRRTRSNDCVPAKHRLPENSTTRPGLSKEIHTSSVR
ncbi:hypothetical protein [Stutzerimonas xanthomarina]|uniref:hypothetical protein n=1 Tax=Stutzerimonas xanthomarina TaxID=271420 RepID=UPI003AA81D9C